MEYYRILGVEKNASALEIKSAYRKMARLYHPDFNPGKNTEVIFIHLKKAYDTLCDPVERRIYDDELHGACPLRGGEDEPAAQDYYTPQGEVIFKRKETPVENIEKKNTLLVAFSLAAEEYAFKICDVLGIAGCASMAPQLRANSLVKGQVRRHGEEVPVIDLAANFGFTGAERPETSSIVIVEIEGVKVGLLVDTVPLVIDLPNEMIIDLPQFPPGDPPLTMKLGRVDDRIIVILEPDRVLSPLTLAALKEMA